MIYIGIDPGQKGAVAAIFVNSAEDGYIADVRLWDTPILNVDGKNKYNIPAMASIIRNLGAAVNMIVLEAVHSMPKQGVASSFSFGEGLGIWKGIIGAYGLPVENVSPQRWKKLIMADQGKEKDAARYKAMQLFPSVADQLNRVKDDGRAEALLMAEYGRRIFGK